ncbi:hypothetical protein SDC9_108733 [bioreactor metagenome]|uniref:Uncharacterized protein n=1 Tax=bioreactor metagenome TaxID=1076179 RepID=A0A645B8T6_9ZZZZ
MADRSLQHIAAVPPVTEGLIAHLPGQVEREGVQRAIGQIVIGFVDHLLEDLDQFGVGVVREPDLGTETACQAGVLGDEGGHRGRVSGHDHDQVVAVVLHLLDQGVDRFLAVLVARQCVGLVDEQHPAQRGGDHVRGLGGGLPEVAGHQFGTVDFDQLPLAEQSDRLVDAGHQPGHRRLAGARVADEDQVPGDGGNLQTGFSAQRLHVQYRRLPFDLGLDFLEPDQFIEFGDQFVDGAFGFGGCLDDRLRPGRQRGIRCGRFRTTVCCSGLRVGAGQPARCRQARDARRRRTDAGALVQQR